MPITPDNGPPADGPPHAPRRRWRLVAVFAAAALVVAGLGTALAVHLGGASSPAAGFRSSAYRNYRTGEDWMLGDATAPGWMRGESLPGFMTGAGDDPGTVMGGLFADAPGPRVSSARARALGGTVPPGATADRSANRLTFTSASVHLVVLASPSMPAESFYVAGMTNPTIVVPEGARVSIELVNSDSDMAHGLVVTESGAGSSWMPMMTASPLFAGAALWFLGESTPAGMHEGTLAFTAAAAGTYEYVCPVPGHAEEGMAGTFVVSRS